jgi:hypothetical protein
MSATATVLRLSTDASRNITGIAGGVSGRILKLINVGTNPIVLKNADANSTAANRFDMGADVTLAAKQAINLWYDTTDSRWKSTGNTAGAAVAEARSRRRRWPLPPSRHSRSSTAIWIGRLPATR